MVRGFFRNDESGKKYLYDIIGIKKETASQYGANTPRAQATEVSSATAESNGFNTDNISQDDTSVNNN
ncbi:MAG: hypothetical protein RR957_06590, partial [Oscillospiraceae bacterium]